MTSMGCFQYCQQTLLQPTITAMIQEGYIEMAFAGEIINDFLRNGLEFDNIIARDIGKSVDVEVLRKALRKVLYFSYGRLKGFRADLVPNLNAIIQGSIPMSAMVQPTVAHGNMSLANDPSVLANQRAAAALNSLASGGLGASTDLHPANPIEEQPTPEPKPVEPKPLSKAEKEITEGTGRVLPITDSGNYPITLHGCVVQFVNGAAPNKTINQRIMCSKMGITAERIHNDNFGLDRHTYEITECDGRSSHVILDHLVIKPDTSPIYFESPQDIFDYMINNLSRSDTTAPYFRVIEHGHLSAINVGHDEFFAQMEILHKELSTKVPVRSNDIQVLGQNVQIMLDLLEAKSPIFKRGFHDYLLSKVNGLLSAIMRTTENVNIRLRMESLRDLNDLIDKNVPFNQLRELSKFEPVVAYIYNYCLDFGFGRNHEATPFPINPNKPITLDPYIKTRKYMTYIKSRVGVSTMDYWQFVNDPAVANEIIDMMKTRTLVIETRITAITNIFAPGVLKGLTDGISKGTIMVPPDITLDSKATVALRYSDDKLFTVINHSREIIKGKIPDFILYADSNNSFINFKVSNTLQNVTLLER